MMSQAASASETASPESPRTQGPARGRRWRAPSWSTVEVMDLIEVWGQAPSVHDLCTRRRNVAVYGRIAAAMARKGHRPPRSRRILVFWLWGKKTATRWRLESHGRVACPSGTESLPKRNHGSHASPRLHRKPQELRLGLSSRGHASQGRHETGPEVCAANRPAGGRRLRTRAARAFLPLSWRRGGRRTTPARLELSRLGSGLKP